MHGKKIVVAGLVLVGIAAAACAVMKARRAGCLCCSGSGYEEGGTAPSRD